MNEQTERNQKIVAECKALEAQDIKYSKKKVGEKYNMSERRVWAIIRNEKFKELLKNDKN